MRAATAFCLIKGEKSARRLPHSRCPGVNSHAEKEEMPVKRTLATAGGAAARRDRNAPGVARCARPGRARLNLADRRQEPRRLLEQDR